MHSKRALPALCITSKSMKKMRVISCLHVEQVKIVYCVLCMGRIQSFPYSGSKATRQKYRTESLHGFEASILSQTQTPLQGLKGGLGLRLAYCLKPRPPPKVEEGSGFETCMYRCTSGELKMKFVAQNYAVLMGFEGLCLNEAKYQQMASCTHQFAESVAF